ncbi:flagellar biosynthesis protein FlgA [Brevibacillus composti]|uniref:Flagellar biosynthesis protein FlgA n=1 Tax=Brevibacillus composti TaxID=2796470 RepID=A0A7T5JNZ9_9BACL|nr:SAF domain-containing protein [Brevibacillus composti]QQE74611.1 flagellar biosynthesis protein FlgA [Brevibacillus composti]QUO41694.1 flagellar biosynthesis protein FlgA [Brevibacillus composti]
MKKQTLFIISIISFLLAGSCFYFATRYIEALALERLYAPVVKVAPGKEILPYEPITRADVVLVQEEVDEILPDSISDLEMVIGKRSTQILYSGEQLLQRKLTDDQLLPEKGKARYEFPLTFFNPVTELRKGDYVKVWVTYKSPAELEHLPKPSHFHKSNGTADLLFTTQLATVRDSNGSEIYSIKPNPLPAPDHMDAIFNGSRERPLLNGEKRYQDYRSQPTALASFIGLNLSDQQFTAISEAFLYGVVQIGQLSSPEVVTTR